MLKISDAFAGEEDPGSYIPPSSLSSVFSEQPVDLDTFIRDSAFLNLPEIKLSDVQAGAVRMIERIYYPELYPLMAQEFDTPKLREYWGVDLPVKNLISLEWGKGSGKDAIARFSSLRVAYLLLCLKSPQTYFGMPDFDTIHLLNIAANSAQAREAFFNPMREAVKRGWFKDKAEPKDGIIQYDKHVTAISGHSDAESQEGLNIMLGVADEIDAFRAKNEMVGLGKRAREASTSAESILKMLKGSASTRFARTYKRVTISYPRYLGSTIQQQTAEAKASIAKFGEKSIYWQSGPLATWEVNPRVKGKEDFAEDYANNPDEAASMYECKPTRATDAYFRNPEIFRQAVDTPEQPITISYKVVEHTSKRTGKIVRGWEPVFTFAEDFKPVPGARYAMHGDLAIKADRAGVAMSHVERIIERMDPVEDENGEIDYQPTQAPVIRNDFTISFSADISARDEEKGVVLPREIQVRWVRMLIYELIKRGFWIGLMSYDQYQSTDSMQILEQHGIETDRVSTDRDPDIWKTVKDVFSEARGSMPFSQLLLNELEALSRVDGGKVDHPPGGCFVGETRIPLLDGTFPQISELSGQQVWVYSATPEGKIVPGLARGRMTKMTTELVDVILDNGYVARCTPEHLWMLRDGSYREAQALRPGIDRLMPIGFTWPVNGGYVRVTDKDGIRTLGHHMVSEFFEGRGREEHEVVHHINENKTDNRPENLEMVDQLTHVTRHAHEFWDGREAAMREGHAAWASDEDRKRQAYIGRRNWRERADLSMESLLQAIRDGAANRDEVARLLECDWSWVDRKLRSEGMTFEQAQELTNNNHKVRAVIPVVLDEPVPVFDLEVDEFHNFALSGGVFVHNSKDEADAFACSIVGAITVGGEEDPEHEVAEVGVEFFDVGEAIAPLIGVSDRNMLEMPIGWKEMSLSGY